MSKSMILLITIFALWIFLILFKKGKQSDPGAEISVHGGGGGTF